MGQEARARAAARIQGVTFGVTLYDRFGRQLVEGGMLLHTPMIPPVYKIDRLTPVMDGSVPPEMGPHYKVELSAKLVVLVPINQRIEIFTMVRHPETPDAPPPGADHGTDGATHEAGMGRSAEPGGTSEPGRPSDDTGAEGPPPPAD